MAKYHITERGEPGVCRAQPGNCPLGDELEHYSTPQDAMTAFEKVMSGTTWTGFRGRRSWHSASWQARRGILSKLTMEVLRANLKAGDFRVVEPIWEESILGKPFVLGEVTWLGPRDSDEWDAVELRFSEKLENLSENEAKEVILHEVAHVLLGGSHSDADGGHSPAWRSLLERLFLENGVGRPVRTRTRLSVESYERAMAVRPLAKLSQRWRGTCERGHVLWAATRKSPGWPCYFCARSNRTSEVLWIDWRK